MYRHKKHLWLGGSLLIVVAVLVDCWWNERIWSFNLGVRASVSKSKANIHDRVKKRSKTAHAQQLLLDLANCTATSLDDVDVLVQVTHEISRTLELDVISIDATGMEPAGYSVLTNFGDSHMSIHTWPETRDALIDLVVADQENEENLRQLLPLLGRLLGGNVTESTFSLIPRGFQLEPTENTAYAPAEIMTRHQYKMMISEVQSPYQNVAVWDHHDLLADDNERATTRSLFLDGVMQSNIGDEYQYHETLVQPAFIASAVPPKRVLIVGGGEGGTLRETLKWKSVEQAVMVDLDAEVIRSSRLYLPTYNNCTGFGTPSCFDDPRVSLFTTDFFKWFGDHIGDDICEKRQNKLDSLFDVIILDLLDPEELPDDQPWAKYLYSKLFFERIACATKDSGVVVSNFGEAPETPFQPRILEKVYPENYYTPMDLSRPGMFSRKMDRMRNFARQFDDFRVFDTYVPAFRAPWTFAMGIVPRLSKMPVSNQENVARKGVTIFDGTPVQVNYKLRQNLLPNTDLKHYNGRMQQVYQQPTADWAGAYCWLPENQEICSLTRRFFDDETILWKTVKTDDGKTSVEALADLSKGAILGAWDEALMGDKIATSMGTSCTPITAPLVKAEPQFGDKVWNPFLALNQAEISSSVVLLKDVKKGDQLTRKGDAC